MYEERDSWFFSPARHLLQGRDMETPKALRHLLLRSRGLGASHGHCPGDETHCSAPPQPAHQQRALKCKHRLPGTATNSSGTSSAGCSTAQAALTGRQPTEAQITAFFPLSPFFFSIWTFSPLPTRSGGAGARREPEGFKCRGVVRSQGGLEQAAEALPQELAELSGGEDARAVQ